MGIVVHFDYYYYYYYFLTNGCHDNRAVISNQNAPIGHLIISRIFSVAG